MVAERARAETVMAALDRRISILDFVGQSWTSWVDRSAVSTLEGSSLEDCSKNVKKRTETTTLKKEDMSIYGQCPAHDDFFLVVCSHCEQVVKPQAFERHCEQRHGPFSKPHRAPSNCSPDRPHQEKPPSQHVSLCEGPDNRCQEAGPPRVPPPYPPHQGRSKSQHEKELLQQVDKISHGPPPSPRFSTPSPRDPLRHQGTTPPKAPPPAEKPLQKGLDTHTPIHGPRTYSRTYKKVPKKDCDLDKHCGVMDPERKKLCTRLLTCNIHSIHQRRQVVGRSKAFDQLVAELKMSSKPREHPPLPRQVSEGGCAHPETPQSTPLHYKSQITSSSVLRSMTPSDTCLEMEKKVVHSEEMQVESLPAGFSSEESDDENREEFAHLPASTCHPKPLGLCTFGARVFGRSMLAYDRRLFHVRSAFSVMMEQHLSAYLWKKIPQVSEQCTYQPLASTNSYNSHDAIYTKSGHKASSLRTRTSGQSELQPTKLTTPSKLSTKAQSASGPCRTRNPAGRPDKQSLSATFREIQESPKASKRRKSPLNEGDPPGRGKILYSPCQKDSQSSLTRTAISSPHGPINGVHSASSKPRPSVYATNMKRLVKQSPTHMLAHIPPSPPLESDKGGVSGLNQRVLGYEQKGRKRKTSGASSPKNASCAPKASILSSLSQTQSTLVSWGGDGRPSSNSHSLTKKLGAQKPKLLH